MMKTRENITHKREYKHMYIVIITVVVTIVRQIATWIDGLQRDKR